MIKEQNDDEYVRPILQPCCDDWANAHKWETDNEGYRALWPYVLCARRNPWCGVPKHEQKAPDGS